MLDLIGHASKKGIERLVCLGDFDNPGLLSNILDLEMKKIIVIGNHDVALTTEEYIYSPDISDPELYWDAWENSPREITYVKNARKYGIDKMHPEFGIRVETKIGKNKICFVHGSLYSEDTCWGLPPFTRGRMLSLGEGFETIQEKRNKNFDEMKKQGYWILFRGHDHNLEVISQNKKGEILEEGFREESLILKQDKKYIATIGRLSDREYAVFDDKAKKLWLGSLGK